MRAVILSTGYIEEMNLLMQHQPTSLLNICGKPIIVYVIEAIKSLGINKVDIVLYHMPTKIEQFLLTGERWGVQITYHIAKDIYNPLQTLKPASKGWENETILFGQGDVLPLFPEKVLDSVSIPTLFFFPDNKWTGWALISTQMLSQLPNDGNIDNDLKEYHRIEVPSLISTRSFEEIQQSNITAISNKTPLIFPSSASEVEPHIWISRGVSIYPKVEIIPPVFIGDETQISEGAKIGPNVVIESHCLIGKDSVIDNSVIKRKSYVGENLNISQCIVDCNILVNVKLNSKIVIKDDFILGELFSNKLTWYIAYFIERVLALLLFIPLLPLYLIIKYFYTIDTIKMLKLPSPIDPAEWETFDWYSVKEYQSGKRNFFLRFSKNIPNLMNVIKGNVHFVGTSPRTPEATQLLPDDWKKLYLNSKIGLITLYDLESHDDFSIEEIYASEVYYAIHMGWLFDLKLMLKWVKKKIINLFLYVTQK